MPVSKKQIIATIKSNRNLILMLVGYSGFFAFITYFLFQRMGGFGCFDDCFNFGGGYFLLQGKTIYKDFFFNHGFIAAYLSALIQYFNPFEFIQGIIISHRLFIYSFSFLFGLLLITRFRQPAFATLIFYEALKFYTFGDRFLAESMVIYPLIYLTFLVWEKLNKRNVLKLDYVLTGFFAWFIIFSREPYAPLTLFLFFLILIGKKDMRLKVYSVIAFLIPTGISFIFVPFNWFFINVFTYNKNQIGEELGKSTNSPLYIAFYPFVVFLKGQWNVLRQAEIFFSLVFLITGVFYSVKLRRIGFLILFLILALANIRPTDPGFIFYQAYHMNIWFGLLVTSTFLVVFELVNFRPKMKPYLLVPFLFIFALIFFSKLYFINENVDKAQEFSLSYSQYHVYSEAIKKLSKPTDTLYLEEKDEVIYPLSDRVASYKYNWYTSFMFSIPLYKRERDAMMKRNDPEFYYDACLITQRNLKDPSAYIRIQIYDEPSCLLIKKTKLKEIDQTKWDSVSYLGFKAPK